MRRRDFGTSPKGRAGNWPDTTDTRGAATIGPGPSLGDCSQSVAKPAGGSGQQQTLGRRSALDSSRKQMVADTGGRSRQRRGQTFNPQVQGSSPCASTLVLVPLFT